MAQGVQDPKLREAEEIDREMKLLDRHRGQTEMATQQTMRRVALSLITMVLIALALWWAMR
jgi:hypothetical protein